MDSPRVLLVIGGGIAAYKTIELVRLLRGRGIAVSPVLTAGGSWFVTPLSLAAIAQETVRTDLFSLTDEAAMSHIELSRRADVVVVAPATADLIAKAANGLADDLASTLLLATDKPVLFAPAMNVRMWEHPATRRNRETLRADGGAFVGPNVGEMACGEVGPGRMAEPSEILAAIEARLEPAAARSPLRGRRALVTAGPTVEAIDPVRLLTNRSSGRQGYAIAARLAELGAEVTLVSGPTRLAAPAGARRVEVESAREMLAATRTALPVDVAVCVAAVSDWRVAETAETKIKKTGAEPPRIALVENPDILASLAAAGADRPPLVIGFAAETEELEAAARAKRARKGCDWILANDVSGGAVVGAQDNEVLFVTGAGVETWPRATKVEVARRLCERIVEHLSSGR